MRISDWSSDVCSSDLALVTELQAHDRLVISAPMHNFSVPSGVQAWIDQIVRIGLTFNHSLDNGVSQYEPLVLGKKELIVTSRRSEERREGKEGVSTGRSRWWP